MLTTLLFEFGTNLSSDVILFGDHTEPKLHLPEIIFRKVTEGDDVFGKKKEDIGAYVLEKNAEIVADGGYLTHYNKPFADLYMEVRETDRNKGFGSFILQEVKKECYQSGLIPAARCNISNPASKNALIKAGFKICGFMLAAELKKTQQTH